MNNNCFIIRDLMPLYNENLLSNETTEWVNEHLENCNECKALVEASSTELSPEPIENIMNQEVMFKKINRKLSMYQIIFVGLSFLIAINTSLLNESFGFILWYPVLGAVTYLFYKDMRLVFLLSFVPIFLWAFSSNLLDFINSSYLDMSLLEVLSHSLISSTTISLFHVIFAFIGSIIGLLIIKIKNIN